MKNSFVFLTLLGLLIVSFVVTGFQCGSASLTSAKLYMKNNDLENAERSLVTEVEKNPANAEAWYLLGDVRRARSNFEGMMEAFNRSLKASPEFAKRISETELIVWGQSVKRGIELYNRSLKAPTDSATAFRNSAISNYKTGILVAPDSVITYQNLAIAYHVEGNYDDEIGTLTSALTRKKDPEIYVSLINAQISKAETAKNNGKSDEATRSYSNAISTLTEARALQPDDTELLATLIKLYIVTDRANEAVPLLREALARDPKNKVFQNDLGLLLLQTGEFEEATKHFEGSIAADENYEDGLWNGAVAYMRWGDKLKKEGDTESKAYLEKFKSAVKLAEKLVSIKKDEEKYWEGLATAYANAGMGKEAQKAFEQAEALKKK